MKPAPTTTVKAAITTGALTSGVVSSRISALDAVIERGLQAFVEVGAAPREISEQRRYREQGFSTFEEFCKKRWGWKVDIYTRNANGQQRGAA